MKKILFQFALLLAVSSKVNAAEKPECLQTSGNFSLKFCESQKEETSFSAAKKTLKGLTAIQFGKNLKVGIITQGPAAKMKISKGIYPECYPARFSVKIYYSF